MPTAALESDPTPSSSLVRNKNLAFFAPPPPIGFGFPASACVFTKLEYLILNHTAV
jgi:hypothetical protein